MNKIIKIYFKGCMKVMTRRIWRIISFIVIVCLLASCAYADSQYGDFRYKTKSDGTVVITKYTGTGISVVIPDRIGGSQVSEIGDEAFYNSKVESVTMPASVKTIGKYAFGFAKNLKKVTSYATLIEENAFSSCADLEEVELLAESTKVEDEGFYNCKSLVTVKGVVLNPGKYAFGFCSKLLSIAIMGDKITENAFSNCKDLESVTILGEGMQTEKEAFYSCDSLKTVTGVVINPESYSFGFCKKLTAITISGKAVDENAFSSCGDLEAVTLLNDGMVIEDQAFYSCSSLKTVTGALGNVGSYAFGFDKKLEAVTIMGTEVEENAFSNCGSLKTVSFITPLVKLEDQAFYSCSDLEMVNGIVGDIGEYAFGFCKNLESMTFAGTKIEDDAFSSCRKLTLIVANNPDSVNAAKSAGVNYSVADIDIEAARADAQTRTKEEPKNNEEVSANVVPADGWICPDCGNSATGKFCNECGRARPVKDEATEIPVETPTAAPTAIPTEEPTPTPTQKSNESGDTVQVKLASGKTVSIRKTVKEALDAYEAFMDGYKDAMEGLGNGNYTTYMVFMEKYEEYMKEIDKLGDDLTEDEYWYYYEVSMRVLEKMN